LKLFKTLILSLVIASPCAVHAAAFPAAASADAVNTARFGAPLIQNSNYYSSNPHWNIGDDYRRGSMGFPTPLEQPANQFKSGECEMILSSVITGECMSYNNCANMSVQSVKPRIMMRLAQIPGKDYSVACGGYIDMAFDNYKARNRDASVNYSGGAPAKPAAPKPTVVGVNQNSFPSAGGAFPGTIHDVSYLERIENTRAGLEEWKEVWETREIGGKQQRVCVKNCAYATLFVENYASYQGRLKTEDFCEWCKTDRAGCAKEINKNNHMALQQACPGDEFIKNFQFPVEAVAEVAPPPSDGGDTGGGNKKRDLVELFKREIFK
jgi:hypothetical protein